MMSNIDYICYIGRPSYQKNTFFLLDVIQRVKKLVPSVKFLLLGVGYYSPDLEQMKKRIDNEGLSDVIELLPWLDHSETLRYLQRSILYLTVSRYEGLPLSVLEAMSLGKAIISSDVVGNRDCINDGYNGYLLPFDADMFTKKVCYLVENVEERERMGHNSRMLYEQNFLIEKKISELEEIYVDMLRL